MRSIVTFSVAAAVAGSLGCATGLPTFEAELGKKEVAGRPVRIPYLDTVSYFGYVAPGTPPDEEREGKKMYYLYLWVPIVAPEIGVRMISPVKGVAKPEKTDFVDAAFTPNAETPEYFDTWVRVERCVKAVSPEDITKPCDSWANFGDNDDTSELPAQPSGNRYNSLLRIASEPSDPMKALVRGLYRIVFTTYKVGEVKGSFLAQVGAPIKIPGTFIAKTPADLAKLVSGGTPSAPEPQAKP